MEVSLEGKKHPTNSTKKIFLKIKKDYAPDKFSKVIAVKRLRVPKNRGKIWAGIIANKF